MTHGKALSFFFSPFLSTLSNREHAAFAFLLLFPLLLSEAKQARGAAPPSPSLFSFPPCESLALGFVSPFLYLLREMRKDDLSPKPLFFFLFSFSLSRWAWSGRFIPLSFPPCFLSEDGGMLTERKGRGDLIPFSPFCSSFPGGAVPSRLPFFFVFRRREEHLLQTDRP